METHKKKAVLLRKLRFKSYYVVWKLEKPNINGNRSVRLNRTM